MRRATFKIRRRIIKTFLFCVLAVLVFAAFSFQVHLEIKHRLGLLEVADELYQDILEARRFEKNFFLYREQSALIQAESYLTLVEELFSANEGELARLERGSSRSEFRRILRSYRAVIPQLEAMLHHEGPDFGPLDLSPLEESLRNIGQRLVEIAGRWAQEQRGMIDHLYARAVYLFLGSILFFLGLGVGLAFYIARLLVRPLVQMQQAVEKIADGDFTPIPEADPKVEEFIPLFRAMNRMIHELEARQEQLAQSRKIAAIGTLTAGVAHELNNPINNIVLTAEALEEEFPQLSHDEILAMIRDILKESERVSVIVRDLLDFSRTERPEVEWLSIADILWDTQKMVRNQLLLSGIQEEMEVPSDLPQIRGDREGLKQVLLNLLTNAIHAMPDGGTLRVCACALDVCPWPPSSSSPAQRWVKVEVEDTGVGIDPRDLPHIFDPFFTTKPVGEGTGLGLSVSYGIVQKHSGSIEVQRRKEAGTTFTILLPVGERE
jgi:signal transduction histidine kinase